MSRLRDILRSRPGLPPVPGARAAAMAGWALALALMSVAPPSAVAFPSPSSPGPYELLGATASTPAPTSVPAPVPSSAPELDPAPVPGPGKVPARPLAAAAAGGMAEPDAEDGGPFTDDCCYRGSGFADKRAHPRDYRERARAAALAEIAREISVTIHSETRVSRTEDAGGWREAWNDSVRLESSAELSGYRLFRRRETPEGYWAEYVLDKREYARARAEAGQRLAAWLSSGSDAVFSDLRARRLQTAWDGLAGLRDSLSRLMALPPEARPAWIRFRDAADAVGQAVRNSHWESSGAWAYAVPGPENMPRARPRLRFVDAGGIPWKGPWRLSVASVARTRRSTCLLRTDAEGRVDPADGLEGCGLPAGRWEIRWPAESHDDFGTVSLIRVDAAWIPMPVRVEAICASASRDCRANSSWLDDLRNGIAEGCGPRYRPTGQASAAALVLRVDAVERDSLEGMYFAALRGELLLPGRQPEPIVGKGGHSDPDRARDRAAADFLRAARRRLDPR